ncbi:MAG: FAD-dependent monooxygenase [Betaproteobacteria bacterium]|nr:FAD-dependent monooxygenase [Betaproteobacteria bacterium]
MNPAPERCDIAVVGGGPVGAALALALAPAPVSIVLLERSAAAAREGSAGSRPIALSYSSRLILERLGAWSELAPTPIRRIQVSQSGRFGRTVIDPHDTGTPELGYVIEYRELAQSLMEIVHRRAIPVVTSAQLQSVRVNPDRAELSYLREGEARVLQAACVVHAEGSVRDATHGRDYAQEALVALVDCEPAAGNCAFERFTADGPLALLPLAGRYAVVWVCSERRAAALALAAPEAFLHDLQSAAGSRAGRFTALRSLSRAPLALRYRASRIAPREAYIGNAAQTLHPVGGQGLNLGLRDAWELARCIRADPGSAGSAPVLERFARARRLDMVATIRITDLLATLFTGDNPLTAAARGAVMTALDLVSPARRFFARRMTFGASALP